MKVNRINELFRNKKNILSIYFTAGYPNLTDTVKLANELQKNKVDLIEIGMPFSDPLADGLVIQRASAKAIHNGMTLKLLFQQLKNIREEVEIPIILMGYLNPILQYGVEDFCKQCQIVGVDGVILPDLPVSEYESEYKVIFENYELKNIFLITPQTSENRIRYIDSISNAFLYMVSSSGTTGGRLSFENQLNYFQRINSLNLSNPKLIGFGIANKTSFSKACEFANGAIIGTAFINPLEKDWKSIDIKRIISNFVA